MDKKPDGWNSEDIYGTPVQTLDRMRFISASLEWIVDMQLPGAAWKDRRLKDDLMDYLRKIGVVEYEFAHRWFGVNHGYYCNSSNGHIKATGIGEGGVEEVWVHVNIRPRPFLRNRTNVTIKVKADLRNEERATEVVKALQKYLPNQVYSYRGQ